MDNSIRSVLACTDLTPASDDVVRAAGEIAARTGAELHLLHALDLDLDAYGTRPGVPRSFPQRIAAAERSVGEQMARTLPHGPEAASRRVEIYLAHRAIQDRAREVDADLIVLGPHRHRPVGDPLLGSTADRVLRTALAPCLLIRGPLRLPTRRTLVPSDLSSSSAPALELALRWSRTMGAAAQAGSDAPEVMLLHVVPSAFGEVDAPFDTAVIETELEAALSRAMERTGAPCVRARAVVRWGDRAAEEIVRTGGDWKADLVVMATQGHGRLMRALLGSVTHAVARQAPSAVLLLPPVACGSRRESTPRENASARTETC